MIELKINGVGIPLAPGALISREIETTLLNREKSTSDFTYPIDMPLTDEVIRALGYPNSIPNPNLVLEHIAEFVENGKVIDVVTVKILRISLRNRMASISIIGSYGSFARIVGDKKLDSLTLGGTRTIGAPDSALTYVNTYWTYYANAASQAHIKAVSNGTTVTDYFFGAALDYGTNIPEIHEDNTNAISGSTFTRFQINEIDGSAGVYKNVINAWDYTTGDPLDPVKAFLYLTYRGNPGNYILSERYFTVPFFRVAYVLRKCFEEYGFTVTGNILSDPAFLKMGLYNTFAINSAAVTPRTPDHSNVYNTTNTITPADHMPDVTIIDFIINVAKNCNLQYDINLFRKTVNIRDFKQGTNQMPVVDLSDIAQPFPEIVTEQQDFNKGFKFSFTYDADDPRSGSEVKEEANITSVTQTVLEDSELPGLPTVVGEVAYVKREQKFYRKESDGSYTMITQAGKPYSTGIGTDNKIEVASTCAPIHNEFTLLRHPVANSVPLIQKSWPVVSEVGISGRSLLVLDYQIGATGKKEPSVITIPKVPTGTRLINNLGKSPVTRAAVGVSYVHSDYIPTVSSMSYDACGIQKTDTVALIWHTAEMNGLYDIYWKRLADQVSSGIQLEYDIYLDPITDSKIDPNRDKIRINGIEFICRRATIVKPLPAIAKMTLVRL